MVTRWIQRADSVSWESIEYDYEYEYRDAEYEKKYEKKYEDSVGSRCLIDALCHCGISCSYSGNLGGTENAGSARPSTRFFHECRLVAFDG
ncbi:MAG: hypothetical protein ACK52S_04665 [Pirellula sp.]